MFKGVVKYLGWSGVRGDVRVCMAVLFLFVLRVFLWFGFEEAKGKARVFRGDRDFGLRDVVPVSASEELECLSVSFGGGCDAFFSRGTG